MVKAFSPEREQNLCSVTRLETTKSSKNLLVHKERDKLMYIDQIDPYAERCLSSQRRFCLEKATRMR